MQKKPNFFIVGAPKCGTTSLATWLASHPQVYMSPVKEPYHFSTDLGYNEFRDPEKYKRLFSNVTKEHSAVGEASAGYLYSKCAIKNILREDSDAKFIALVRNPVEMAQSLHQQYVYDGEETILSFEQAWNAQEIRRKGLNIPRATREPKMLLYFEMCQLGSQIKRLYELVNKRNYLILVLDDIKKNPQHEWFKILDFIGLDDDKRCEFPTLNRSKKHKSYFLSKVFNLQLRLRRFFHIPSFNTGVFQRMNDDNTITEKTSLNLSSNRMLSKAFTDEIQLLEQLLNRDFSHWLIEK